MYWAIRRELPIVLRLEGGSYDFERAKPFLQDLENNLYAHSPIDASVVAAWLDAHMISFSHVATTLAEAIPSILTLSLSMLTRRRITSPRPLRIFAIGCSASSASKARRRHPRCSRTCSSRRRRKAGGQPGKRAESSRKGLRRLGGKSDEENATLLLQSQFRMKRERQAFKETYRNTVRLQAFTRSFHARKRTKRLRVERDALIVIMLWMRSWVYRHRRKRLQQAEKDMRFELVVRRHCGGRTAGNGAASTTAPKEVSARWSKMRDHTATLLCRLKAVGGLEANTAAVVARVEAEAEAEARAKTTAAVAAEAMVSESTLASSSRWRSVSGRVRGAIRFKNAAQTPLEAVVGAGAMAAEAVVGAGATVLEAVSLPFKDRKHPPALSIDIEL